MNCKKEMHNWVYGINSKFPTMVRRFKWEINGEMMAYLCLLTTIYLYVENRIGRVWYTDTAINTHGLKEYIHVFGAWNQHRYDELKFAEQQLIICIRLGKQK